MSKKKAKNDSGVGYGNSVKCRLRQRIEWFLPSDINPGFTYLKNSQRAEVFS